MKRNGTNTFTDIDKISIFTQIIATCFGQTFDRMVGRNMTVIFVHKPKFINKEQLLVPLL
jgi:hypothetical protein